MNATICPATGRPVDKRPFRTVHLLLKARVTAASCLVLVASAAGSGSKPQALATTPSTTTGPCALLAQSEIKKAVGGHPKAGKTLAEVDRSP